MARLEKDIVVRRPRRVVYDYLINLETRADFLPPDHRAFRITSASPRSVGATIGFQVELGKIHPAEIVLTGVLPPEGVTEIVKIGPLRATQRYALEEHEQGTCIRLIVEYRLLGVAHKLLDPFLWAPALKRWQATTLERLQAALERETEARPAASP